jgi:glycosyltransferase involved in cell wall biosynthesis
LRILHLASGREWRGGQRQTWLLTTGLAERGVDQKLITRKGSELARRAEDSRVPVIPVTWDAGLDPRVLPKLVRVARDADVMHAHDAHAVTLASAASRLSGTPFIATRRMTRALRRPGTWRRATRVIAISEAVKRSLLDSGVPDHSITIVTPAIDVTATTRTTPVEWSAVAGVPPDAFVVVAVAALTAEKGIDLLIDAMADSRLSATNLHCVIAGDGPERDKLLTRARALDVLRRVHLWGHVSDPLPLIAAARALVMPSREEAFGSTILDALALGVPVIAAAVGGIPEALAYGGGRTFPAGDTGALAGQLHALAADPGRRAALSQDAAAAARQFDLPAMVERTLSVYRSVMEDVERQ